MLFFQTRLDHQIAERKYRDQKEKQSDKKIEETQSKKDLTYASNSHQMMEQKRETSHQIQEYNAAAAKQKRAKDKYDKEQDKIEANNNYGKPSVEEAQKSKDHCQRLEEEKEDMAQKERAISRDIQKHISKLN